MLIHKQIDSERLPGHVAIIMDGNGRWARHRGMDRIFGHQQAVDSVRNVIEISAELGIKYLTLYAFSTENWDRPDNEISALMSLMVRSLNNETDSMLRNNIKLLTIGDIERLTKDVKTKLLNTIKLTSVCTGLNLIIALSYGSRWEITRAARRLASDVSEGKIKPVEIEERVFEKYLQTSGIPDPDLMIRTSGELRISNFLLWQLAYTELYFTEILWPDFGKEEFYNAIVEYQKRERRFGKISEQIPEK
jgi:undecaprenyl diphosphate synthase